MHITRFVSSFMKVYGFSYGSTTVASILMALDQTIEYIKERTHDGMLPCTLDDEQCRYCQS